MPTPIDILLDPLTLCMLGLLAALMLWERVAPGRALPWHGASSRVLDMLMLRDLASRPAPAAEPVVEITPVRRPS